MEFLSAGIVAAGFFIGVLVGLTGMGGGSLTTPILILFAGVRPTIAVGTDLVFSAATKWLGASVHLRQRTVDLRLAALLAAGSVPSSLLGVAAVKRAGGLGDAFVTHLLGVTLILVAAMLVGRGRLTRLAARRLSYPTPPHRPPQEALRPPLQRPHPAVVVGLGAVVGFLVGVTSVGSGTLIVAVLLILYPKLPASRLVGTDVAQAALLTTAAGIAHLGLGHVDLPLAAGLLAGSLPGVAIGSRLSVKAPEAVLRPILAGVLLVVGIKLA